MHTIGSTVWMGNIPCLLGVAVLEGNVVIVNGEDAVLGTLRIMC